VGRLPLCAAEAGFKLVYSLLQAAPLRLCAFEPCGVLLVGVFGSVAENCKLFPQPSEFDALLDKPVHDGFAERALIYLARRGLEGLSGCQVEETGSGQLARFNHPKPVALAGGERAALDSTGERSAAKPS
jgi:hypothetical protein